MPSLGPSVYILFFVSFVSFVLMRPSNQLAAARNGVIRGRVELRRVSVQAERRPGVSDLGAPPARDVDDRLRSVAGHSKSIRFDRPGIVRVFCDIHSHMSAFILVFGHPYFAVTDTQGRYHIDNVPPGSYGVIAWNEGNPSDAKPVTVPDGAAAELDFALR